VKDYSNFVDIECQKRISHSITRWLSLYPSLPKMIQMYPASHSYLMSIDKPTVLKLFFGNYLSELCLRHHDICNHFWLLLMSKFGILKSPKHHFSSLYRVRSQWRQADAHSKPS